MTPAWEQRFTRLGIPQLWAKAIQTTLPHFHFGQNHLNAVWHSESDVVLHRAPGESKFRPKRKPHAKDVEFSALPIG